MDRCHTLYLSPHLDDVALSCAGRIRAERAAGHRVVVATLFSRGRDDAASRGLYATRREEDARAMALLGAEPRWLDLPDAPGRDPFYHSFRPIILEEAPGDRDYAPTVGEAVRALWEELEPEEVCVPLGVGTHIDHRLTFEAAKALPAGARVLFYEDRPYAFVDGNLRMRLHEIGAGLEVLPADLLSVPRGRLVAHFTSSLREAGYVRSWLPPGPERLRSVLRLARRLVAPSPGEGPVLRAERVSGDDECLAAVEAAVGCYESQLEPLFGSRETFRAQAQAYAKRLGLNTAYGERYWRLEAWERPKEEQVGGEEKEA